MASRSNIEDPITTLEGTYNGLIIRMGYAIRDPANFGPSTRVIFQECSKQFQDALDDCQIQIDRAKWYLEDQLRQRKEARARALEQQAVAPKRKHDEIEEPAQTDTDPKRPKVWEPEPDSPAQEVEPVAKQPADEPPEPSPQPPEQPEIQVNGDKEAPEPTADETANSIDDLFDDQPEPVEQQQPTAPAPPPPQEKPADNLDDFLNSNRPSPSADPGTAGGTIDGEDFNFTSMFGDPTGDDAGMAGDGDPGFDLNPMGEDDFAANFGGDDPNQGLGDMTDLNALLPGVESYANQDQPATLGDTSNAAASMDFSLPELSGPNEFDAMLDGLDLPADGTLDTSLDWDF
jgi:hypothetical protein